ncbi:MAG: c-type cytochrome [Nitrospirota bacterium]
MRYLKYVLIIGGIILFVGGNSYADMGVESDPIPPRVPADQMAAAKAMKNPIPNTPENIEKGKALFHEQGTCFNCHGEEGRGDGPAGIVLDPGPRNFTNPEFHKARTDGELFWVIKNGSPGTGMVPLTGVPGAVISEEEAWTIILYERSLSGK